MFCFFWALTGLLFRCLYFQVVENNSAFAHLVFHQSAYIQQRNDFLLILRGAFDANPQVIDADHRRVCRLRPRPAVLA